MCAGGLGRAFLQQRTAVCADPARPLLLMGKSSTAWMQMPGWENAFVIALSNNKHFRAYLLLLRVVVWRVLPNTQPVPE